jgi:hypothetical protein
VEGEVKYLFLIVALWSTFHYFRLSIIGANQTWRDAARLWHFGFSLVCASLWAAFYGFVQ